MLPLEKVKLPDWLASCTPVAAPDVTMFTVLNVVVPDFPLAETAAVPDAVMFKLCTVLLFASVSRLPLVETKLGAVSAAIRS